MHYKEHVVHYLLQGKINLSQFDKKFLSNMSIILHRDNRVTSNQAKITDSIILKYKRQLEKNQYDAEELVKLPWSKTVVESTVEYTGANVSLNEQDELIVKVPFNKRFIQKLKKTNDNPFIFDNVNRCYRAPFSTVAFKICATELPPHFKEVIFAPELDNLLKEIKSVGEGKIWNPTLIKVNDQLIVAAANEFIGELISTIDIKQDPRTFNFLIQHGVKIDASLQTTGELCFAASFRPEIDIDECDKLADYLNAIGCDRVVFATGLSKIIREGITEVLANKGISVFKIANQEILSDPKNAIMIRHNSTPSILDKHFMKMIVITNSRPIEIK